MHHIFLRCGWRAFFFKCLAHGLVGERVDIGQLDHVLGQKPQGPAGLSVSGCETSLARAITWRALGRAQGSNGGSWLELARVGTAPRRSCTTLSGDRPFRTRWRRAL